MNGARHQRIALAPLNAAPDRAVKTIQRHPHAQRIRCCTSTVPKREDDEYSIRPGEAG